MVTKRTRNKPKTWIILIACIFPPCTLIFFMIAAEEWRTNLEMAVGFRKECKASHMTSGFVRKSIPLAEMSAITAWIREVQVYGNDYSLWSNASRKIMKCEKLRGSDYISCTARASPCKVIHLDTTRDQMVQKKLKNMVTQ